jgi:DNA-binding winged helix-turn-helix (wHTH) protein
MNQNSKHIYKFDQFQLDETDRILTKSGKRIQIPPKVFDTLLALVQKSGQIADKEYLIGKIWPTTFVEENNLNKTVSAVRKVLGDSEGRKFIETIPKRGYLFSAEIEHDFDDMFGLEVKTVQDSPLAPQNVSDTKTSLPTLILSSYVPTEELRDKSVRDSSHNVRGSKDCRLIYRDQSEKGYLRIEPNDPYLDLVRNSGDIRSVNYWHSPWRNTFAFPTLDIKLVNNTDKTLFFHEIIIRVRRSKLDPRPIPIISGPGYMTLPLDNIGWGPMENAVLRFSILTNGELAVHEANPTELSQYPFELRLGDVETGSDSLSLDHFFETVGIDVDTLRTLWRQLSNNEVHFDEEYFTKCLDSLEPSMRSELEEDLLDLKIDSTNTKRMHWSEYQILEKQCLGPFSDRRAFIVGELEYGQTDPEGNKSHQIHKVTAPIWLTEPMDGAPMAPSYSYQICLEVEAEEYTRKVPISHVLKRGETDRVLLVIAAERSSIHEFDLTLRYNEIEQLKSTPVVLELFLSRLDAVYVEDKSGPAAYDREQHQ